MSATPLKTYRIDPREIIVREDRDLPLSEKGVNLIVASLRETGEIREPIQVRKTKTGVELIDGLHRREAAIREGLTEVEVKEWSLTQVQAKLMEADANVSFTHANPVDLAVGLAGRKRAYEALHPETKAGVVGGLARQNQQRTLMSFAEIMAELVEVTPRQIRRIVAAGESLSHSDIQGLRDVETPIRMNDLYVIAKTPDTQVRAAIVSKLVEGKAKSAADALRAIKNAPKETPADAQYRALSGAFLKASPAVKRRFIEAFKADLRKLLAALPAGDADE